MSSSNSVAVPIILGVTGHRDIPDAAVAGIREQVRQIMDSGLKCGKTAN